eukprot:16256660-Heterocapsa_arctica.AAC.1
MIEKFEALNCQDAAGKQQSWPNLGFIDLRKSCSREIGPRGRCPTATGHKEYIPRTDPICADIIQHKEDNCRIGGAANPGPG